MITFLKSPLSSEFSVTARSLLNRLKYVFLRMFISSFVRPERTYQYKYN